jgi:hypothetical protein
LLILNDFFEGFFLPVALYNGQFLWYNTNINSEKGTKMTEFEKQCYGMSESNIREEYMNSLTAKFSGNEMVVMSLLSDIQHMVEYDMSKEQIRKQLNVAKFILSEMMDMKEAA